ncbi:SIMPL domain-containing protein [Candidatus Parcubacteria bacterium]|uniref:SIMPL domain-containing protein n=1 Tax=Candidatus Kaiserbacteria bacterium CG10_big_fil_rev_8_21_14_0_10_47_16 TaxID=1974608 RepID=A0A2H0UEN0_9BACT|nr:SIMPL domain-containing protein [Candidatus Parcubacteria bacterium]PIR84862.1 MAG: hypothetical protein COU16_00545 [Candidatus Kaiserbacteria bacterium CG10_big_fil_rev_8_21_14_0_10_47_16]
MFSLPYMRILVPVLTLVAIVALGAYINATLKEARYMYSGPVVISVTGDGEIKAISDIATFSFGVSAEGADAATAQSTSAEKTNAILDYLKAQGVEDKDIKTSSYNLNPRYEWGNGACPVGSYCPQGERTLVGYEVSQTVTVKVRKTDTTGDLISGVTDKGATNVSGVDFTIDDEDVLKAQAREEAITDAREKAEKLAKNLNVRIVRMTGFWENEGPYPYAYGGDTKMMSMSEGALVAPQLPVGENTVTSSVNISYEVR